MAELSVIVPVYNSEKYVARCVDSLLRQTYRDMEIILVDDGSTDSSGSLCDTFALADSRVKVIHKPNGGVSSARNAGIRSATGRFVAFVDSDDYCSPDMYEKLFSKMRDDVDIVQCDFMLDYGSSHCIEHLYDVNEDDRTETIRNFILSGMGGGSVNMIIRRALLETRGLSFPEYLTNGEDFWFVLRLLASARKVAKVAEPLYWYDRTNEVSITHTLTMDIHVQTLKGYEECLRFIKQHEDLIPLAKAMCWKILQFKTCFLFRKTDFVYFRQQVPEANAYISSCPLLSPKMKLVMCLVRFHLDGIANVFVQLYKCKGKR